MAGVIAAAEYPVSGIIRCFRHRGAGCNRYFRLSAISVSQVCSICLKEHTFTWVAKQRIRTPVLLTCVLKK